MIISATVKESEICLAKDWGEALSLVNVRQFDIALLDLFMPAATRSWQEALAEFISVAPNVPVCIVSTSNNQFYMQQALKLGAKGYIRKNYGAFEVRNALYRIKNGGRYTPKVDDQSLQPADEASDLKLTWRQKEILMLIAEGKSNKQIGERLDITEGTVKRHVYNLFQVLNAKNRIDALHIAKNQGLLTP